MKMNQKWYISKVLERFSMPECKPRSTPCEQKVDHDGDCDPLDPKRYCEVVGCLIYLTTYTRPDLSCIVIKLSQYLSESNEKQ